MSLLERSAENNTLWCFGLFIIGLIARAFNGLSSPIWLDEAWRIAEAASTIYSSPSDLLLFGMRFETSIQVVQHLTNLSGGAIRLPYIVVSAVAIPVVFLYVRQATSFLPAFLAATWVAFSPWHVTYSNELAAYGVGSTLIMLMTLIASKTKISITEKYFAIFLSFIGSAIHLYLAVAMIIFTFINCIGRSHDVRKTFFVAFLICSVIFCIKLNYRFAGYSDGGAINFGAGIGWWLGYPIRIITSIFLLPMENRWIPTSYDLTKISIAFPVLSLFAFCTLGVYTVKEILRNKWRMLEVSPFSIDDEKINRYSSLRDFGFVIIFLSFIYLQAFFLDAKFIRYIVLIFPLIVGLFLIFAYNYLWHYGFLVKISVAGVMILNVACFLLVSESSKYKSNYNGVFSSYYESCSTKKTLFVNTYFVETTISRYYLEKTDCSWFESKAYHNFFINKNRSTLKAVDAEDGNYDLIREVRDLLERESYDRLVVVQNRRPIIGFSLMQELSDIGWRSVLEQSIDEFTFTSLEYSQLE